MTITTSHHQSPWSHHEVTTLTYDQVVSLLRCNSKKMKAGNWRTCNSWSRDSFPFHLILRFKTDDELDANAASCRHIALHLFSYESQARWLGRRRGRYRSQMLQMVKYLKDTFLCHLAQKIRGLRFWCVLFNAAQLGGFTQLWGLANIEHLDLSLHWNHTSQDIPLWMMWPSCLGTIC